MKTKEPQLNAGDRIITASGEHMSVFDPKAELQII